MWQWLKNLFSSEKSIPQPKVWLVRDDEFYWHKAVCYAKPTPAYHWAVMGPFRSEVDAEEIADRMNLIRGKDILRLYSSSNVLEKEAKV